MVSSKVIVPHGFTVYQSIKQVHYVSLFSSFFYFRLLLGIKFNHGSWRCHLSTALGNHLAHNTACYRPSGGGNMQSPVRIYLAIQRML